MSSQFIDLHTSWLAYPLDPGWTAVMTYEGLSDLGLLAVSWSFQGTLVIWTPRVILAASWCKNRLGNIQKLTQKDKEGGTILGEVLFTSPHMKTRLLSGHNKHEYSCFLNGDLTSGNDLLKVIEWVRNRNRHYVPRHTLQVKSKMSFGVS